MKPIEEQIFSSLAYIATGKVIKPENEAHVRRSIKELIRDGWAANEVIRCLLWSREVNSTIEEDVSLHNMAAVRKQVTDRLTKP